jgi:hypothetical protein
MSAFDTPLTINGPYRQPRQLLAEQSMNGTTSIHDDATAATLRLTGAPIEGPTHFASSIRSPTAPGGQCGSSAVASAATFRRWWSRATRCRPRSPLPAPATPTSRRTSSTARRCSPHGLVGDTRRPTALASRLDAQQPPTSLWIIDQLAVGMTSPQPVTSVITSDKPNGPRYPFSLREKLDAITEPSPWYRTGDNRWGRPILPFETISVLAHKDGPGFPVRQPCVGLFLDLEVRLHGGPLFVDEPYDITHTIVAMSESRRTESFWTRSAITTVGGGPALATVRLHQGVFKDSYPDYPRGER